jgi:hypothetical protein
MQPLHSETPLPTYKHHLLSDEEGKFHVDMKDCEI